MALPAKHRRVKGILHDPPRSSFLGANLNPWRYQTATLWSPPLFCSDHHPTVVPNEAIALHHIMGLEVEDKVLPDKDLLPWVDGIRHRVILTSDMD